MDRTPRRATHGWDTRCTAHSKQSGEQCKKWAMAGLTVCRSHGGAAHKETGLRRSEAKRAVEERQRDLVRAERKAAHFLATYGVDVEGEDFNATAELLRLYREAVMLERAYRLLVEDLGDDLVTWSKLRVGALHPLVEAWHAQQERVVNFGVAIGKLGIEQREMALQEQQTHALLDALLGTFADSRIGMTIDQQQTARRVVAERLRTLDSEPVPAGRPPRPALSA